MGNVWAPALKLLTPQPNQPQAELGVLSTPHRGARWPHLEGPAVGGRQLPLVIQHLLEVRHVPVLVGGVAVEPLQRPSGCVPTAHLLGIPGVYPQGFPPTCPMWS